MTEPTWEERFIALYPEAFRLAKERERERPLRAGDIVTWMRDGTVPNERAMELLLLGDGTATLEGWQDGMPLSPDFYEVPAAHITRAQDVLEFLLELGHRHGLCRCHSERTATMH
ncbi:MAG TPA: hypothetical protein VD862_02835 [Candidatus Paceibacterota bacterium]|nr:hypothetical protein [Candidatus Paceibacterota bacterium]